MIAEVETPAASTASDPKSVTDAANRVIAEAAPRSGRAERIYAAEMEALKLRAMTARSPALGRLIRRGIAAKETAEAAWEPYGRADEVTRDLRQAGAPDDQIAAAEVEYDTAWKFWEAKRRELEEAADDVAGAPFSDLRDIICRAEAAALLLGTSGDEDMMPDTDEDRQAVLLSYRAAIEEMIQRAPDRQSWDDGIDALRTVEKALSKAYDEEERARADAARGAAASADGPSDTAEFHRRAQITAKVDDLLGQREQLRTSLLSIDPPDIEGLLDLMDIVFDHSGKLDVSTYERRATIIGNRPVTETEQWNDDEDSHRRALALIAHHAARLRDLEKPRDWREAMRDIGGLHPNAKDAVHRAYGAGMDVADLKNIQLAGQPEKNLPTLLFFGDQGQYWVRPDSVWEARIFNHDAGARLGEEAVQK